MNNWYLTVHIFGYFSIPTLDQIPQTQATNKQNNTQQTSFLNV